MSQHDDPSQHDVPRPTELHPTQEHRLNRIDMAVFDAALEHLTRAFGPLAEDGAAVGILIDVEGDLDALMDSWAIVKKEQS